jgi:two-component system chemotaxis response regulator CheB
MPIRVLIVDDSALIRQMLTEILTTDGEIEVVGTAPNALIARERIKALAPDVITLDIEMPHMDGLSFLEKLMALHPLPVIMVSTLGRQGPTMALRAMELGAVDWVAKPTMGIRSGMEALAAELIGKVKMAAATRPRSVTATRQLHAMPRVESSHDDIGRIVAIGASTGGVEALRHVIGLLPPTAPSILITQHMPPGFTASFARRMNEQCAVTVMEATDGAPIRRGHVYVAPGSRHLEIAQKGKEYICRLHDEAPVSGHRPSVDVLFRSVAELVGADALGIILTGMGRDGAAGLLAMRQRGARTLGQSEASCVIYGMPRVAKEVGAVENEMTLDRIAEEIVRVPIRNRQAAVH